MKRALFAALVAAFAAGCEGRPRTAESKDSAHKPRTGPLVVVLDLSSGVPEEEHASLFAPPRRRSFDQLSRVLNETAKDKDAKGVLVKFGPGGIGLARAEEIGGWLSAIRASGRHVHCHADGFSNATLLAAARGCSKIVVSPAGEVETIGIAAQIVYMHKLIADELKISVDFLQIGKFKGAEEPFTRDGPSDEARASLESTLADLRDGWLGGIREGRPAIPNAEAAEDGPYSPARARALGLVDDIGYADDVLNDLKKASGAVRDETRFGGAGQDKPDDFGDVMRVLAGGTGNAPVALVRATGGISMSGGGGLFGGRSGILQHELTRTLGKIERDDDVKAMVLRIDSPGGSALASDLLWHDLMRIRKKKPVIVSVGEMAASGGYYLACTGSYVFADATSIVGSIGVVGGKLAFGPALEKVGVHAETFTGKGRDPKAAARASYLSVLTPWDDATRERVRETMTGVYDLFLARIAEGRSTEGRKLEVKTLAENAEGRIFSGREGKARGLVDEIGGLREALAKARAMAKLPADAGVQVMGGRPSFFDALDPAADETEGAKSPLDAARPRAFAAFEEAAGDLAPFASGVLPLVEGERSVVALPFALVLK